jgi:hypothetical protein
VLSKVTPQILIRLQIGDLTVTERLKLNLSHIDDIAIQSELRYLTGEKAFAADLLLELVKPAR